jgi:hypothetical protein
MFRFCLNHLQGASGSQKKQTFLCIVNYVQIYEYYVKNKYNQTLTIYNSRVMYRLYLRKVRLRLSIKYLCVATLTIDNTAIPLVL